MKQLTTERTENKLFLTLIVKKKHNIGYSVGSRVLFMSYLDAFITKLTVFADKLVIERSDNAASQPIGGNGHERR